MELAVINHKGQDTGRKVSLSDEIFGIEPNDNAIYLDVKQYLANQRQGNSQIKRKKRSSWINSKDQEAKRYRWCSCWIVEGSKLPWWR